MHREVVRELASVGTHPDENGNVRLYHATDAEAAASIVAEGRLRPREPDDLAERALRRGGGSVFLSTSAAIADDVGKGSVVLAVDVRVEGTPAEVIRAGYGHPPRVELEAQLPPGADLPLAFADRLDHTVTLADLPAAVQDAIVVFEASHVGQQLTDPEEREGRCQHASICFLPALRDNGADGTLVAWGGDGWWHCGVLIAGTDVVVDWTASQLEPPEEQASVPYPRIEPHAQADARWGASSELDIDSPAGRYVAKLPELRPWREAQRRISDRDA